MTARNKNMLITAGIALVVSAGLIWSFNNITTVKRALS